jgi:hypothetical protein
MDGPAHKKIRIANQDSGQQEDPVLRFMQGCFHRADHPATQKYCN